jgi:8-oxo-dGTP diphosphatase
MKIVTAAILEQKSKFLLARRSTGSLAGFWEFPGGKVEPGESEEAGLSRELKEELGINTRVGALVTESLYTYSSGQILLRAYEVAWIDGTIDPQVHDQIDWVKAEELLSYTLLPADIPIAETLIALRSTQPPPQTTRTSHPEEEPVNAT